MCFSVRLRRTLSFGICAHLLAKQTAHKTHHTVSKGPTLNRSLEYVSALFGRASLLTVVSDKAFEVELSYWEVILLYWLVNLTNWRKSWLAWEYWRNDYDPQSTTRTTYGTAVYIRNDVECTCDPFRWNYNNTEMTVATINLPGCMIKTVVWVRYVWSFMISIPNDLRGLLSTADTALHCTL